MSGGGYLNPIHGSAATTVRSIPPNRSLVVADSLYRLKDPRQSPYDFVCRLNAALDGKDMIYQKLYWNQPIFSHNNSNCEFIFQINGDTTTTYVVYATPFLMYTEFDGNPVGTTFLPPQSGSYASNMELGLNGDVRDLSNNTVPLNVGTGNEGKLLDADGFVMTVTFRYSPTKGFVISFVPSVNPLIPVYTIRLLPCTYIAYAHYVHGFGDFSIDEGIYIPRPHWTVAYFSDGTPSLLPFRYIVVESAELVKDRRLTSFQNSSLPKHLNELAIFPLQAAGTGSYQTYSVGSDATVVSKRDDYMPEYFRITIYTENGKVIQCDDPIGNFFNSELGDPTIAASFLPMSGSGFPNRGNPNFTNYLVFGTTLVTKPFEYGPMNLNMDADNYGGPTGGMEEIHRNVCLPAANNFTSFGTNGSMLPDQFFAYAKFMDEVSGTPLQFYNGFPLVVTDVTIPSPGPIGFYGNINTSYYAIQEYPGHVSPTNVRCSQFNWTVNTAYTPQLYFANIDFEVSNLDLDGSSFLNVSCCSVGVFDWTISKFIAYGVLQSAKLLSGVGSTFTIDTNNSPTLSFDPNFIGYENQNHVISFFIFIINGNFNNPNNYPDYYYRFKLEDVNGAQTFRYINLNVSGGASPLGLAGYVSPAGKQFSSYPFGNPLADGLCEELIHELVVVSDKN